VDDDIQWVESSMDREIGTDMRTRLILAFCLVVLVTVTSVVGFVRFNSRRQVEGFMMQMGSVAAIDLVQQLEQHYVQAGNWQGVDPLLDNFVKSNQPRGMGAMMRSVSEVVLVDAYGKTVYDTSRQYAVGEKYPTNTGMRMFPIPGESGNFIGQVWLDGNSRMFVQGDEQSLLLSLNAAAVRAGLFAAGISLVLALLLSSSLTRPVQRVAAAVKKVAAGDLEQRLTVKGNDELAALAASFNQMAESLKASEGRRKAMTADIAHELRTPLAVQRAHLEALQDGLYPLTTENLDPIIQQNLLLTRLVEDLRTLALADSGELKLNFALTDMNELVVRQVDHFKPAADRWGITFHLETPPEVIHVMIDRDRIQQVLNNLLDNALTYTPEGGKIAVNLRVANQKCRIAVTDSGPGIPADALGFVFDRFYRADPSRSREYGGSGLGLAIARQIASAHQGNLTAENDQGGGGAVFTLTLPVQS
jgi:two-component system, OmpR family, sensor histidine kinase BaeS